jgi:hypothetical protein
VSRESKNKRRGKNSEDDRILEAQSGPIQVNSNLIFLIGH